MNQIKHDSEPKLSLPSDNLVLDWAVLKKPLIIVMGIIFLIGLGYGVGIWFYHLNQEKLKVTEEEQKKLQDVYDNFLETKNIFDNQDYEHFIQLKKSQFYMPEKMKISSSEWQIAMEEQLVSLQTAVNQWHKNHEKAAKQLTFNYSRPELLRVLAERETLGKLGLYFSKLSLDAALMHEGYALELLAHIKSLIPIGLLNLTRCQLEPLQKTIDPQQTEQANIKLKCIFHWYITRIAVTE